LIDLFYLGMQLVSHPKEGTKIEDVWEDGAEHKFSIEERKSNSRLEIIT
jgi:hypothetical protein